MTLLHWFEPLESATSLGDLAADWEALLARHHLCAGHADARYRDAIFAFLGRSALPARLKLAAILAFVSSFDLDLRMVFCMLDGEYEDGFIDWPEPVAATAELTMPCLDARECTPWLQGFLSGRLLGLRDTLRYDGAQMEHWRQVFWNGYLEMSCRWADLEGVQLALRQGADTASGDYAAFAAAAAGTHAGGRSAYHAQDRTHAQYCAIVDALIASGTELADAGAAAVYAAACADNDDMLAYLAARGADVHAEAEGALAGAAGNFAATALEWLLAHGADVHAGNDAALSAAAGAFDLVAAEALLDVGADLHVNDECALRTALTSTPIELYGDESDLLAPRADMIVMLANRGARLDHPVVAKLLAQAHDIVAALRGHEELGDARCQLPVTPADRFAPYIEMIAAALQVPAFLIGRHDGGEDDFYPIDPLYSRIVRAWADGADADVPSPDAACFVFAIACSLRQQIAQRCEAGRLTRQQAGAEHVQIMMVWLQESPVGLLEELARRWRALLGATDKPEGLHDNDHQAAVAWRLVQQCELAMPLRRLCDEAVA